MHLSGSSRWRRGGPHHSTCSRYRLQERPRRRERRRARGRRDEAQRQPWVAPSSQDAGTSVRCRRRSARRFRVVVVTRYLAATDPSLLFTVRYRSTVLTSISETAPPPTSRYLRPRHQLDLGAATVRGHDELHVVVLVSGPEEDAQRLTARGCLPANGARTWACTVNAVSGARTPYWNANCCVFVAPSASPGGT